jgi:hypothetical protein
MPRPSRRAPQQPEIDPETPVLDPIKNDIIEINLDKWFKKAYPLDFGMAHVEITSVLEDINDAIQRASVAMHDAKKSAEQLAGAKMMKLRQEWTALYSDKMTEATVNAVLAQDEDIIAEWHRYAVLKSYVQRLDNTMENLRLKLGAMRSFEATRRRTLDEDVN